MKFALITEGPSEHRIIKHIVVKYFKDEEPDINQIQPKLVDGRQANTTPGGWNEVLKYCEREELNDILVENDYLIIQIDTDQSQLSPFNISHTYFEGGEKSIEDISVEVIEKLNTLIRQEIKDRFGNKIFFAICVHTIECWLLPLFYENKKRKKHLNCLDNLNEALAKNDIHIITSSNKNDANGIKSYETILKNWKRKKEIIASAQYNSGFKKFIDSLATIVVRTE